MSARNDACPQLAHSPISGEVRVSFDVENGLRDRRNYMHMKTDNIDCFVREVKASASWVESDWPNKPAVYMQVDTFKVMAERCNIDISKLWFDPPDYHD